MGLVRHWLLNITCNSQQNEIFLYKIQLKNIGNETQDISNKGKKHIIIKNLTSPI